MGALDGRLAIITGGGRGIGREHALPFAAGGMAVASMDSVTDFEGAKRIVDTALEAFGGVHGLVNMGALAKAAGT